MYKLLSGTMDELEQELNATENIIYLFPFSVTTNYDGFWIYHVLVLQEPNYPYGHQVANYPMDPKNDITDEKDPYP